METMTTEVRKTALTPEMIAYNREQVKEAKENFYLEYESNETHCARLITEEMAANPELADKIKILLTPDDPNRDYWMCERNSDMQWKLPMIEVCPHTMKKWGKVNEHPHTFWSGTPDNNWYDDGIHTTRMIPTYGGVGDKTYWSLIGK